MEFMYDWENEGDRFSFDDSERFEEESICSWLSEPESLNNNWRGWKRQNGGQTSPIFSKHQGIALECRSVLIRIRADRIVNVRPDLDPNYLQRLSAETLADGQVLPLVELASRTVACFIPFEVVEKYPEPIPEDVQLRITFWSFPENEEDIRLYSCLANGSAEEFQKGDHLYKAKAVKNALQIGFHLSASVCPPNNVVQMKGNINVAIMFDRRRISSCTCTCDSSASWCSHVVAVCLFRIHQPAMVRQRAPVSETLSRLHRDQLQKFAQYLITELPQQILPTAQRLLDDLLSSQESDINKYQGAPDPTAGPSASEQTCWCLDEATLHENVKKTLVKFCVPSPVVFSDVNFLTATAPPAAAEWQSLLRPLRGREPEGMWNLLSIVREMFRRSDSNAIPLLEIITDEVLQCEQILIWWFMTKISSNSNNQTRANTNSSASITQHAASSLCDEIVILWRLAALNPKLSPIQKDDLCTKFKEWHISSVEKVKKAKNSGGTNLKKSEMENFAGFKPGIEACQLLWDDYTIPGITYSDKQQMCLRYRFNRNLDPDAKKPSRIQPVTIFSENLICTDDTTTLAQATNMLQEHHSPQDIKGKRHAHSSRQGHDNDGAFSSGSEGFCEPGRGSSLFRDSDSGSEMKEINSRSNSLEEHDLPSSFGTFSLENLESKRDNGVNHVDQSNDHNFDVDSYMDLESGNANGEIRVSRSNTLHGEQSSDSHISGDEYSLYLYDRSKVTEAERKRKEKEKNDEPNYFASVKILENRQEILCARAEALHAHGHTKEACKLAEQLAEELLANPPDLLAECAAVPNVKGKKKKALTNITMLASHTLSKAAFLCSVLLEEYECWHLAFKVGMFGLELPRPPASCKALEVKLAYQESELLTLLKKIPLGPAELTALRERAEQLKEGTIKTRGDALLPIFLASFIFDALCLGVCPMAAVAPCIGWQKLEPLTRQAGDEKLGFEGCVAALGMKANVSEAEHPLLCESTRKQRGELAIAMLVHYKDDQVKLSKVMDKLLDKEVHQSYKAPSLVNYLSCKQTGAQPQPQPMTPGPSGCQPHPSTPQACPAPTRASELDEIPLTDQPPEPHRGPSGLGGACGEPQPGQKQSPTTPGGGGARPKTTYTLRYGNSGKDTDSSALEEEGDDFKALEAKLRCMAIKKKPSQGMAAIDSSAPETTSSDNSPTLVRRVWGKHQGPGSDCGSSGDSDSIGSSSSGDKDVRGKLRDNESPPSPLSRGITASAQFVIDSRSSTPNLKGLRFKGKTRIMPTIPNQPSEASAHWMFEVAKTVLIKAGGSSSTSLFTQPSNSNQHTGPHRNLQLCAFQIGLYALGLNNCVSPNWLSRTYSSHVSWITGQAMEIGSAAVNILIDTWEGHLTPPEVASLADRASRGRDSNMVKAAAELALSCLPHAQALNPSEVHRALFQSKEQSREMLEKACLAVESAAKGGGVYPEVLFHVSRRWHELSEEAANSQSHTQGESSNRGTRNRTPTTVTVSVAVSAQQERSSPASVSVIPFSNTPPHSCSQVAVSGAQMLPPSGHIATQAVVLPFPIAQASPHHPTLPQQAYVQPTYNIVQQIQPIVPPFNQQPIPIHAHNIHPYVTTFTYQNSLPFSTLQNLNPQAVCTAPQYRHMAPNQGVQVIPSQSCQVASIQGHQQPPLPMPHLDDGMQQQQSGSSHIHNPAQANYLQAAFRVGMLALDTLARRVHDDRPQAKYARNPPNGEDVKWLLGISLKLGTSYLQQFCASVVNAVVSPFILYDIAVDAAQIMARNNPAAVQNHLRSNILAPLLQKCLQMFIQCAHQRIHHISPADYEDFVSTICSARNAFSLSPGGMVQFQELLQSLRRSKSCRKELWQRIVNGLATPPVNA